MNEHQNKEWTMRGCQPVRYIVCYGDIWLSQRSMAEIYGLSLKTINEHLVGLVENMGNDNCRTFRVTQKEGLREISRSVKHYPLSFAYGVGIKSQRFDKLEAIKNLADKEGVDTNNFVIPSNKEYLFGKMLIGALEGIAEVLPQHFVDPFWIDFYIPSFNLAVEHDDEYHFSDEQREKDAKRQKAIEDATGMKFIRVTAGDEVRGLNDVLKTIFGARSGELPPLPDPVGEIGEYPDEMGDAFDAGQMIDYARAALAAQPCPPCEGDDPAHPLHKRVRAVADWLIKLAPKNHIDARDVLLRASSALAAQASGQDREDAETQHALKEGERNAAVEAYFKTRTQLMDTNHNRRIFEAGFDRGYDARAAAKGEA